MTSFVTASVSAAASGTPSVTSFVTASVSPISSSSPSPPLAASAAPLPSLLAVSAKGTVSDVFASSDLTLVFSSRATRVAAQEELSRPAILFAFVESVQASIRRLGALTTGANQPHSLVRTVAGWLSAGDRSSIQLEALSHDNEDTLTLRLFWPAPHSGRRLQYEAGATVARALLPGERAFVLAAVLRDSYLDPVNASEPGAARRLSIAARGQEPGSVLGMGPHEDCENKTAAWEGWCDVGTGALTLASGNSSWSLSLPAVEGNLREVSTAVSERIEARRSTGDDVDAPSVTVIALASSLAAIVVVGGALFAAYVIRTRQLHAALEKAVLGRTLSPPRVRHVKSGVRGQHGIAFIDDSKESPSIRSGSQSPALGGSKSSRGSTVFYADVGRPQLYSGRPPLQPRPVPELPISTARMAKVRAAMRADEGVNGVPIQTPNLPSGHSEDTEPHRFHTQVEGGGASVQSFSDEEAIGVFSASAPPFTPPSLVAPYAVQQPDSPRHRNPLTTLQAPKSGAARSKLSPVQQALFAPFKFKSARGSASLSSQPVRTARSGCAAAKHDLHSSDAGHGSSATYSIEMPEALAAARGDGGEALSALRRERAFRLPEGIHISQRYQRKRNKEGKASSIASSITDETSVPDVWLVYSGRDAFRSLPATPQAGRRMPSRAGTLSDSQLEDVSEEPPPSLRKA